MIWLLVAAAFSVGAVVGFLLRHILVEDAPPPRQIETKHREDTNKWRH